MRMSASVSQEHSSTNCWRVRDGNHPVAHTVAERRARAEALEAERRRARRANLEASEAALEAARQRAHSLRAARSLELRNREEERHAKVVARRKLLEEVNYSIKLKVLNQSLFFWGDCKSLPFYNILVWSANCRSVLFCKIPNVKFANRNTFFVVFSLLRIIW